MPLYKPFATVVTPQQAQDGAETKPSFDPIWPTKGPGKAKMSLLSLDLASLHEVQATLLITYMAAHRIKATNLEENQAKLK